MAGEYQVLRTLREMQEGKMMREERRMATALGMMQFAATQRQQEFQNVGARLQMLSQVNDQLMISGAQEFVTSTGLGAVYANEIGDDEDQLDDVSEAIVDTYGLKDKQASRVASALYSFYKTNDSTGIMSIANDIGTSIQLDLEGGDVSDENRRLVKGLYAGTPLGTSDRGLKTLSSVMQVYQNRSDIQAEIMEYGVSGDVDISRDIGVFEPGKEAAPVEAEEPKFALGVTPPKEQQEAALDAIKDMQDEVAQHRLRISELDTTQRFLNQKSRSGIPLTDAEEKKLVSIPELQTMEQADIDKLSGEIKEQVRIKNAFTHIKQQQAEEEYFEKYPGNIAGTF